MSPADQERPPDRNARIRRSVQTTILNWLVLLLSLGVIVGWGAFGLYELGPGESAVVLRVGRFDRVVETPGLKWHWPPPLEQAFIVNVTEVRRERFGLKADEVNEPGEKTATFETAIQTADSNIVNLSYVVQYSVADPYPFLFGLADPIDTLRDAAQSAVREVVGRKPVDAVLSSRRGEIQEEAKAILQATLDGYFNETRFAERSAFEVGSVVLQIVQPPAPVQDAFDDVVAAQQDEARAVSQAQGDAKVILEEAEARSQELLEAANAFKDARILEADGEAQRFVSVYEEYARAPEVTRRRLYLEALESVLPNMEKWVVAPEAVNLLPVLRSPRPPSPPPVASAPAGGSP